MELTTYQTLLYKYWLKNYYTIAQMRNITNENPTSKRHFNYEQFEWIIGISVEEYDNNVDFFKDMHYNDIQEYLSNEKIV